MRRVRVTPRARSRPDRGGDPLDGLVNLFDLGIVLSVAFLLAALSSLELQDLFTNEDVQVIRNTKDGQQIIVRKDAKVERIDLKGQKVVGRGSRIGSVYRLNDGRVVYVEEGQPPPSGSTPTDPGAGGSGSGGSGSGGSGSGGTDPGSGDPGSGGSGSGADPGAGDSGSGSRPGGDETSTIPTEPTPTPPPGSGGSDAPRGD